MGIIDIFWAKTKNYSLAIMDSEEPCAYVLAGDLDNNCKVDFYDLAKMAANWLIDCDTNPNDPACVPE